MAFTSHRSLLPLANLHSSRDLRKRRPLVEARGFPRLQGIDPHGSPLRRSTVAGRVPPDAPLGFWYLVAALRCLGGSPPPKRRSHPAFDWHTLANRRALPDPVSHARFPWPRGAPVGSAPEGAVELPHSLAGLPRQAAGLNRPGSARGLELRGAGVQYTSGSAVRVKCRSPPRGSQSPRFALHPVRRSGSSEESQPKLSTTASAVAPERVGLGIAVSVPLRAWRRRCRTASAHFVHLAAMKRRTSMNPKVLRHSSADPTCRERGGPRQVTRLD